MRRRNRNRAGKKEASISDMELTIPTHFQCPISLDLMKDPVSLSTGITYDRESIEKWIESGNATCPVTNQVLRNFDQIPNHAIRKMIQEWCVENKSRGVERIPTPRVPITLYDVLEISSRMLVATRSGDEIKCQELVRKIKDSAKESERNRRCIVSNGIGIAMADMFASFAGFSAPKHADLLREILSALTWSFPLGKEVVSKLKSVVSLSCMVSVLNGEDLSSRKDVVFVLKEVISADPKCVDDLMKIEGIEMALFNIVKVPICPRATQTCLVVMHQMMILQCQESLTITLRFVRMGLIPLILDILVEGNKCICEKALGVLDRICDSKEGKESAYSNALTVPLVVKKILRVSETGTDFSILILWKLIVGGNENVLIEAVQLGAFQKLLVVLQVGCGEITKEKVTELLKLMNTYRDQLDCFDSSMGFKQLKRP
ncbi:U-box domain-containing protein 21 [Phtheirospermum japonicum]|uniref:U-box domain-containing protein n=1 Tax=Phtheirospermum japonicum TaxID=374723 RepID=A0A830CG39_9LAMI|nr:U-box domain-containing protein 21 [Phtheirospermum japonicum]